MTCSDSVIARRIVCKDEIHPQATATTTKKVLTIDHTTTFSLSHSLAHTHTHTNTATIKKGGKCCIQTEKGAALMCVWQRKKKDHENDDMSEHRRTKQKTERGART
jgi:hypothetical protein